MVLKYERRTVRLIRNCSTETWSIISWIIRMCSGVFCARWSLVMLRDLCCLQWHGRINWLSTIWVTLTQLDLKCQMEKAIRETQTLRAGCSKMDPKNFAPPQTPFPGAWDGQNLISWRWSLPLPTDPVWWRSMHAISSYRGNRPTNKHRPP